MELFFYAFALSTLFNAMPGAITVETFRHGMRGGFMPAFNLQIGSIIGDVAWVIIALTGVSWLFLLPVVKTPLTIFGIVVMLYLALQSYQDSRSKIPNPNDSELLVSGNPLIIGVLLSVTNPLNVIFWVGMGGTIAAFTESNPTSGDYGVFLAGFTFGALAWSFFAAWFFTWTGKFIGKKMWFWINILISGMFLGFAGMTAVQLV